MSQAPASPSKPTQGQVVQNNRDAAAAPEDSPEGEEGSRYFFFNVLPSWMVSFIAHIVIIVALAIYMIPIPAEKKVVLEAGEASAALDEAPDINVDLNLNEEALESEEEVSVPTEAVTDPIEQAVLLENADFGEVMGADLAVESEFSDLSNLDSASETSSRSDAARADMLKKYGGTAASEEAVALSLKWIIAHQLPDGGWSFDHQRGPGDHRTSPDPGEYAEGRNGATAMALLPLLGAGQTHRTGQYKAEIDRGLYFLLSNAKKKGRGISFWEQQGSMYSHGLAAIVLNEAYAMTQDPTLAPFAQGSLYFIEDAQDPVGGGWRYNPREPGDTSAVGWQMMALKSGNSTGMKINPRTIKLCEKFLDSVSTSGGAFYGYMDRPRGQPADARTAIGLLSRMYMGWKKDAPGLVEGIGALAKRGPRINDEVDMYYNYYATQVMKQTGGKDWTDWNSVMRENLVKTQIKDGPGAGSWSPRSVVHADSKGGRLYATSLSCMTLEVYYRFLPIYGEDAADDEFKLD